MISSLSLDPGLRRAPVEPASLTRKVYRLPEIVRGYQNNPSRAHMETLAVFLMVFTDDGIRRNVATTIQHRLFDAAMATNIYFRQHDGILYGGI